MLIGVVSDTHGRLDPRVHEALAGVEHILHAGDVGSGLILDELETIAPVTAVHGNVDAPPLAFSLPGFTTYYAAGRAIGLVHDLHDLPGDPPELDVVVHGHTHVPEVRYDGKRLLVNPGSTSRGRSGAGRSVALLEVAEGGVQARLVPLGPTPKQPG